MVDNEDSYKRIIEYQTGIDSSAITGMEYIHGKNDNYSRKTKEIREKVEPRLEIDQRLSIVEKISSQITSLQKSINDLVSQGR